MRTVNKGGRKESLSYLQERSGGKEVEEIAKQNHTTHFDKNKNNKKMKGKEKTYFHINRMEESEEI